MKTTLILLLAIITVALAAVTAETKATPKAYPLKTCIVTDNDLDSMGEESSFVHEGQTIKVCCKPCIAKFEKNPAKYLKKIGVAPAPGKTDTPGKGKAL